MTDNAFERLVYAIELPDGADTDDRNRLREELRPLVQDILTEVAESATTGYRIEARIARGRGRSFAVVRDYVQDGIEATADVREYSSRTLAEEVADTLTDAQGGEV